jgi:beta-glucanase (GH16 family)
MTSFVRRRRALVLVLAASAVVAVPSLAFASSPRGSATTKAVAAAPTCGGTAIPKSGGGTWTCTFDDEFTGSALDTTKWAVQTTAGSGFHTGLACMVNTPDNVAVSGGYLNLTVRGHANYCKSPTGTFLAGYTAGSVDTYGKFTQAYGRFEIRAKFPTPKVKGLKGVQESLWLWPQNATKYGATWPTSGEIDIAEAYSLYPGRAVPYIHYVPAQPDPNVTNNNCLLTNPNDFHTFVAEWTPSTITISYDGTVCVSDTWNPANLTKPAPFDQPFMIALTQGLGIDTNAPIPYLAPVPATTQVDYVRVWK